jgi:DMSO/TMAO reductase YedYZ molybdopterin-dependent catalytic subunit
MKEPALRLGTLIGFITAFPVMAILYLGEVLASSPFIPFEFFDWLARTLPGNLVTLGIDAIVELIIALNLGNTADTAKSLEQALALLLFLIAGAIFGVSVAWLARHGRQPGWIIGGAGGAALFLVTIVLGLVGASAASALSGVLWIGATLVGWGMFLGAILAAQPGDGPTAEEREARRALLIKLAGGSAGLAIGAWGLGRILQVPAEDVGAELPLSEIVPTETKVPTATGTSIGQRAIDAPTENPDVTATATMRDRVTPAPGTRPELTSNEEFYRIDINTRPPVLDRESWRLQVTGLFEFARDLTLDDLTAFPSVTQPITLSCISNRIAGDLIGTSNWTGARLRDVLEDLGMHPDTNELVVESADGFFESVVKKDMMDPRTLLVYGMNGETLPVDHGFPLRIYIPNRYGMKQPKWITHINAIPDSAPGYWVVRGWDRKAIPHVVSVIDTVATNQRTVDNLIPVGGIAWAGDRGISKVELQFDGGEWVEAVMRTPGLSPLTWIQWRYDWNATPGKHTIRVRATDGQSMLQIEEESGVRPDGATGYHELRVNV